jgi:DNA-binding HxlR family transcriptional regulator
MRTIKMAPSGNHSRPARRNTISGCPLTAALAGMGGKWKLIIVYWLAESPKHYAGIRRAIPGISQKVLTQQLRELESDECKPENGAREQHVVLLIHCQCSFSL